MILNHSMIFVGSNMILTKSNMILKIPLNPYKYYISLFFYFCPRGGMPFQWQGWQSPHVTCYDYIVLYSCSLHRVRITVYLCSCSYGLMFLPANLGICRKAHLHTQSCWLSERSQSPSLRSIIPVSCSVPLRGWCRAFLFDQDHREYAQTPQPPDLRGTLIANPQPPSFGGFIPLATEAGAGKGISLLP